jgi:hypothetical protein
MDSILFVGKEWSSELLDIPHNADASKVLLQTLYYNSTDLFCIKKKIPPVWTLCFKTSWNAWLH